MFIFTTHTAYNGLVGIVDDIEMYELNSSKKLHKEVHCGAIYFRAISSMKRYSLAKIENTKKENSVGVLIR